MLVSRLFRRVLARQLSELCSNNPHGKGEAVDLGGGSWNQEHDGDTKTYDLYRFMLPKRNTLRLVSMVMFVLQ